MFDNDGTLWTEKPLVIQLDFTIRPLLTYSTDGGQHALLYKGQMDFFDDGPEKPVRIWGRLLILHDDPDREFNYTAGAEQALEVANQQNWAFVSIKNDWSQVFATPAP